MTGFLRSIDNSEDSSHITSTLKKIDQRILFLFIAALLLLASGLGLRDPWPADEPRFVAIALEMLKSGQWLIPTRGGELYPDKPPLLMWLIALGIKVTGSTRIGFLLPSLFSGLITIALVCDLARRLWRYEVGLFAGFLTLFMIQLTMQAKVAQTDALFTMWLTLGVYGLVRHVILGPSWKWYSIAWIAMGFGALTKIAGFFPAFMLLPFVFMSSKLQGCIRFRFSQIAIWALGPLLFFAVVAAWLGPVWLKAYHSSSSEIYDYLHNILWVQTFHRYEGQIGTGHLKPFYYYGLEVLPWAWFPVTLFLYWLAPEWYRRIKERDATTLLLLSYVLFLVIFFSISPSKRGVYMLPTTPIIALLSAPYLYQLQSRISLQRISLLAIGFMSCVYIGLAIFLSTLVESKKVEYDLSEMVNVVFWALGIITVLILFFYRKRNALHGLWLSLALFWLAIGWFVAPSINQFRTPLDVLDQAETVLNPDSELAILDLREQFLLFSTRPVMHFGKHTPYPNKVAEASRWLKERPNRWVLVNKVDFDKCFKEDRAILLSERHRQHWYLVGADAITGDCVDDSLSASRYLPKVNNAKQ